MTPLTNVMNSDITIKWNDKPKTLSMLHMYIWSYLYRATKDKDILSRSMKTSSDIFALMLLSSWEGECFYFSIYVLVSVCPNPSQVIITEMKQYFKYIER